MGWHADASAGNRRGRRPARRRGPSGGGRAKGRKGGGRRKARAEAAFETLKSGRDTERVAVQTPEC
jgi:hypothetical protein